MGPILDVYDDDFDDDFTLVTLLKDIGITATYLS